MESFRKYILFLLAAFSFVAGNTQTGIDTVSVIKENDDPFGVFDAFSGKPGKAGLYSLILPGAGQLYNKQYWKVPLFVAAEGITIGILIYNINNYREWDQGYKSLAAGEISQYRGLSNITTVRNYRDNARQDKDYSWVALIAVHIIAGADAFVGRHMIEFDVSDDIGISLDLAREYPGLSLAATF